jgi:hypothetical protein
METLVSRRKARKEDNYSSYLGVQDSVAIGVGGFDEDVLLGLLGGMSRVVDSIWSYRWKAYTTSVHKAKSSGFSLSGSSCLLERLQGEGGRGSRDLILGRQKHWQAAAGGGEIDEDIPLESLRCQRRHANVVLELLERIRDAYSYCRRAGRDEFLCSRPVKRAWG